ncbi:MAG: lipopolysaccharide biosynthesis protein, partial [Candidatus Omnitrophica bacterium]|nr:lipopolysaccharide biosynthesis protein [Candidatus Omnitrophota bacterium]
MELSLQEASLSGKVIRGGVWVFILNISTRLLSLIRLVIVARIISPYDFGLIGIAFLTMSTLETFSATGFHAALIQKKDNIKSYLDAAWTILVMRGVILFTVLFLIAPVVASFFKTPEAALIIRVIGLSILFHAFTNIGVVYFNKELEFKKLFLYQFSGTIADFVATILALVLLRNVWALVFGLLVGSFVRGMVSHFIHPYSPRLNWDKDKVKELFGFGKWVLGSSILVFFIMQGDDIFVGKILGVTALGLYQMAYKISNLPATEITRVVSQIVFPVYSKMQDNIARFRESYLRVLQLTAFLSMPLAGILFILAPDLTKVVLGEKWLPMVGAMRLLAVWGGMRAIGATSGTVFMGLG